jgi:hypothetical protein
MTLETAPDVLSVSDVSKITRLGRDATQKLFQRGTLPNIGTQKRFLTPKTALKRWFETAGQ